MMIEEREEEDARGRSKRRSLLTIASLPSMHKCHSGGGAMAPTLKMSKSLHSSDGAQALEQT